MCVCLSAGVGTFIHPFIYVRTVSVSVCLLVRSTIFPAYMHSKRHTHYDVHASLRPACLSASISLPLCLSCDTVCPSSIVSTCLSVDRCHLMCWYF